jgi:CSLREA domain-containing protein
MSRFHFANLRTRLAAPWDNSRRLVLVTALLAAGLMMMVWTAPAESGGATFTVTRTEDGNTGPCAPDGTAETGAGQCTLREAIMAANGSGTADTIILGSGTYSLTISGGGEDQAIRGDLDIAGELTIQGSETGETIIDGQLMTDRVLDVLPTGKLTLSDVTIRGGSNNPNGGGINNEGSLTILNAMIEGNDSNNGGGVMSSGTLLVENTTFANNTSNYGGGLYHVGGPATIRSSTFVNNRATGNEGGAIYTTGGVLTVENSTLSANSAAKAGGALATGSGTSARASLVHTTLAYNSAPTGSSIRVWRGEVRVQNSILAFAGALTARHTSRPLWPQMVTTMWTIAVVTPSSLPQAIRWGPCRWAISATTAAAPGPMLCPRGARRLMPFRQTLTAAVQRSRLTSAASAGRSRQAATSAPSNSSWSIRYRPARSSP